MEISFKRDQIEEISFKVGIPKTVVYLVISRYVDYLKGRLEDGNTVKFLNICYLKVSGREEELHETLAYIANELGKDVGQSQNMVFRILLEMEEMVVKNLSELNAFTVRGLVRVKVENTFDGYRVRVKKSTVYNGHDVYITTLPSFKRKVYKRMEAIST